MCVWLTTWESVCVHKWCTGRVVRVMRPTSQGDTQLTIVTQNEERCREGSCMLSSLDIDHQFDLGQVLQAAGLDFGQHVQI